MSMFPIEPKVYDDGRTKQAFKDSCDINRILDRARRAGTLSHLEQFQGEYGDFSGFDFFEANLALARGKEIFGALPAEVRKEFDQDPGKFFEYVNDPANADDLAERLPELAEPGRTMPVVDASRGNPGNVPGGTTDPAPDPVPDPAPDIT